MSLDTPGRPPKTSLGGLATPDALTGVPFLAAERQAARCVSRLGVENLHTLKIPAPPDIRWLPFAFGEPTSREEIIARIAGETGHVPTRLRSGRTLFESIQGWPQEPQPRVTVRCKKLSLVED